MLSVKDLDEIRELIKNETKNLPSKDDFYKKMDELMKELKAMREIEYHETRIDKVEEILNLPQ